MTAKYIVGEMHQYEWYPKDLPNLYIQRVDEDGTIWSIPVDENNMDYRAYLEWCEEGNVPETYEPPVATESEEN